MTNLLDAALRYASAGWPVFPLKPRSKAPACEHGFLEATLDRSLIEGWWRRDPLRGVGLATGYKFDVIDFDSESALENFIAEADEHDTNVDGPIVMTRRGAHCYVLPSGLGTMKPRPGIDYKAVGGYVVAPPSIHQDDHSITYRWLEEFGPERLMTPAPSWLLPKPKVYEEPSTPRERARGDRPGDLYNASGRLPDLLRQHGWVYAGKHGKNERWVRPGKDPRLGISATFDGAHFCVFSSNAAPFEFNEGRFFGSYTPFAAYALLEHDGNYSRAAEALREVFNIPSVLVIGGK